MNTTIHTGPADLDDVTAERDGPQKGEKIHARRRIRWSRVLVCGLLPGLALVLAIAAGYLKWLDSSARNAQSAGVDAVSVASDTTVAMLSYKAETVENDLNAARDRLTGSFKEAYTSLTHDVVIPGSKQQHISARAKVVAAAPVSANETHAVVLLFIDQTVTTGGHAPSETASTVRVTLDKVDGQWLISQFDPI